jgi:hypothetical protein
LFTASFEWTRVEYSSIFESLGEAGNLGSDEFIDDADELHLGAEYALPRPTALFAFRAGVWLDPDHQVRTPIDEPFTRALLPPGDDEIHYALGFGVAFKAFQIDLGADFSDPRDTIALSAIYSF